MPIIYIENVTKTIKGTALFEKINLAFEYGQMVFIVGETGCGKTTLLKMLAGWDTKYTGTITFQQKTKVTDQRARQIAFIHQRFPLISYYTIEENITLFKDVDREKMRVICHQLGIESLLFSYPSQLSGGEKQRVALARALLKETPVLLADEPTSSLSEEQADHIMSLLKKQAETSLVIVVTHQRKLAEKYGDFMYDMTTKDYRQLSSIQQPKHDFIHVAASFRLFPFLKKQFKILWQDKIRYILPLLLWTITGFIFISGFHFYHSFSQHLLQEEYKRVDGNYLQIKAKNANESWVLFEKILEKNGAQLLQPFHVLLNQDRKMAVLYVQNTPQYQPFYFEIVPLMDLDKNMVVMNQLFYQKSGQQVDQIYLQFDYEGKDYTYLLPLAQVIDDGGLYQSPRLYISYDFCAEQWPDYHREDHHLYYLAQDKMIKQQLLRNQEARFLFEIEQEAAITYYYSTYMVHKFYLDMQQIYRPLALLLLISLGITIASLQGLFFLYLLDYRRQEMETLQESGLHQGVLLYVSLHDLVTIGMVSFIFCVFIYFVGFLLAGDLPFMLGDSLFYTGIFYAFLLIIVLLTWASFYVWLQRNKKRGKKRKWNCG